MSSWVDHHLHLEAQRNDRDIRKYTWRLKSDTALWGNYFTARTGSVRGFVFHTSGRGKVFLAVRAVAMSCWNHVICFFPGDNVLTNSSNMVIYWSLFTVYEKCDKDATTWHGTSDSQVSAGACHIVQMGFCGPYSRVLCIECPSRCNYTSSDQYQSSSFSPSGFTDSKNHWQ